MYQAPSAPTAAPAQAALRWSLVARLCVAAVVSALIPGLLTLLAMQGIGGRISLLAAAVLPLSLLSAWAFVARKRPSTSLRSGAVLAGIVGALVLSFFLGALAVAIATLFWEPQINVVLPQPGA